MTTAITMKITLGALEALASSCERKSLKMKVIQCHASNIAFLELNHPSFSYAKELLNEAADKRRTYAGVANRIQAAITEINRVIEAAHAEALEVNETVDLAVRKFKYGSDNFQAIVNLKNATHSDIIHTTAALGWTPRSTLKLIRRVWTLGGDARELHKAHMAAMAAGHADGSIKGYDIPF